MVHWIQNINSSIVVMIHARFLDTYWVSKILSSPSNLFNYYSLTYNILSLFTSYTYFTWASTWASILFSKVCTSVITMWKKNGPRFLWGKRVSWETKKTKFAISCGVGVPRRHIALVRRPSVKILGVLLMIDC